MKAIRAMLLLPAGLALAGCMSYGGGETATIHPAYTTYAQPAYGYATPYPYGAPPTGRAIVAPSRWSWGGSASADADGDGVPNHADRYPGNRRFY